MPADHAAPPDAIAQAIRDRPVTEIFAALMIRHLAFAIDREGKYPRVPELRARLERIEALARRSRAAAARELIECELADPDIFGLLANGVERALPALSPLPRPLNLANVGRLAAAARARRPEGPEGRGRGKFYPDPASGPDALEYCALIVSMAWRRETRDWPGQRNPIAAQLCELLWRAAGGAPHGGDAARDGALSAWRRHIVAARRYRPPHCAGIHVERSMDRKLASVLPQRQRRRQRLDARPALLRLYASADPMIGWRRRLLTLIAARYRLF